MDDREKEFHENPHVMGNVNSLEYDEDDFESGNDTNLEMGDKKSNIVFSYIIAIVIMILIICLALFKILK